MKKSTLKQWSSRSLRLLSAMLLLFCATLTTAAAEAEMLIVIMQDGTQHSYVLTDKPKVTFDGTQMNINSAQLSDAYTISEVKKFVFADDASAIAPVAAGEQRVTFTDGTNVVLEGLNAGTQVSLYDLAGHALATVKANGEGQATLSLETQAAGVYVVSVSGGKSFKLLKR